MTTQTFFNEINRLLSIIPKSAARLINSEDCQFCHNIYNSSKLYLGFDDSSCKDSFYIYDCYMVIYSGDCDYSNESESCYESVDAINSFNCSYLNNCVNTKDSDFCWYCINCHDVFGCVNLHNKSYCIFNRQLSETEYKEQVKKYKMWPKEKVFAILAEIQNRFPSRPNLNALNENSPYGNYAFHNKNCYLCFDAAHNNGCGYLYDSFYNSFCYDLTYASRYNENSYQLAESGQCNDCNYTINCNSCQNCSYIFDCKACKNCFGCTGLRNKQFCFLNRQLTEEGYKQVVEKILPKLFDTGWNWNNLVV